MMDRKVFAFAVPQNVLPEIDDAMIKRLQETAAAHAAAQKAVDDSLKGPVYQTIADGLARQKGMTGVARLIVSEDGEVAVEVLTQPRNGKEGRVPRRKSDLPSASLLWADAQGAGVDISDLIPKGKKPSNAAKKAAVERLEAAKKTGKVTKRKAEPTAAAH